MDWELQLALLADLFQSLLHEEVDDPGSREPCLHYQAFDLRENVRVRSEIYLRMVRHSPGNLLF